MLNGRLHVKMMDAQKNSCSCNTKVTNDQWLKCPQGKGL